jgi:adenylate kinase family enzyme
MNTVKIAIVGAHGVGKSTICKKVYKKLYIDNNKEIIIIPEQFREVVKDVLNFTKQTKEITSATYAKQSYLENLYTAQGVNNILCDRSVLDTFIYFRYFQDQIKTDEIDLSYFSWEEMGMPDIAYLEEIAKYQMRYTYLKVYLIEPSDREIENDDFRMTDKKEQLEIHKLFLEYFKDKDFKNVVIVDQEKQDDIVKMVCNDFNV